LRLRRRTKKTLITLLLAILTLLAGFLSEHASLQQKIVQLSPGNYRITQLHDGDTISVDMDGIDEEIRFIGVDTPETQDPRKAVQCFGKAASQFTKQLIDDQPVRLEADPLSSNRDRYGRLLRYVYLPDGRLVQAEIIKEGYGFAVASFPFTKSEEFSTYQKQAREQNKGLWSNCSPVENEFGGFTSNNAE
jgi:endonuclease YncB( thermonuclease family)